LQCPLWEGQAAVEVLPAAEIDIRMPLDVRVLHTVRRRWHPEGPAPPRNVLLTLASLVLVSLVLAAGTLVCPLYSTAQVTVRGSEIIIGSYVERAPSLPPPIMLFAAAALVAASALVEFFMRVRLDKLSATILCLAFLPAVPLPHVYIISLSDVAVVLSNHTRYLSLTLFCLALLTALINSVLTPRRRARVIADLSVAEEKTHHES